MYLLAKYHQSRMNSWKDGFGEIIYSDPLLLKLQLR